MFFFKPKPKPEPEEAFFSWDDAVMSVGVADLNADHRQLATQLCRIHEALTLRRDRAEASRLLERLLEDTRRHFAKEEAMLRQSGYPELEAHVEEHEFLLRESASLLRQFQGGTISGLAFPNFLKHWLLGHILDADRKYSGYLRRKGLR